jgi:putative transposase
VILAHKIRLVPTPKQEDYFRRACGTARFAYNWALSEWQRQYAAGEKPSGVSLNVQFNGIRREQFPWTYCVHRDCTSRPFKQVQWAYSAFFSGISNCPKFKKKGKCRDSFYFANDRFVLAEKWVRLARVGAVKIRESLRWSGKIMGATVVREVDAWFLVVQVDVGNIKRERIANNCVGIDLGVTTSVTLSTGEKIGGPKAFKVVQQKLRRLCKAHARKKNGSENKKKATLKLARCHRRIANIRGDFLHKMTTRLCSENQAIGIEDLGVQGMLRYRKLARVISDESFGEFRRQLAYKSHIWNSTIVVADRFFPSSKTCSACGFVLKKLPLSSRTWVCPQCGETHDRDINAAKNLVPWATGDVKPVEMEALARPAVGHAKLLSRKQEFMRRFF